MGWKTVTAMSQRREFVQLALREGVNMSELCRRFGISRKTGYKFLNRYQREGVQGLCDRSRRPLFSPYATDPETEGLILAFRDHHPAWGGRKLKRRLENLGYASVPSASTITAILKRNGRIAPQESEKHTAWKRFEAEGPNNLWQMDFKGHFPVKEGRCHPLTILDDHSRYALCIAACANEQKETVQDHLTDIFRRYGLPYSMLVDNGPPWAHARVSQYTKLTVWLLRLDINIIFSRRNHPQTLGKDERFHRTLKAELISSCINTSMARCQQHFDRWRVIYNTERPHEALHMEVPATKYRLSQRLFPEKLGHIEYGPDDHVRKVQDGGKVHFKNKEYQVSRAFKGQPVAIRPTHVDGEFDICFLKHVIGHIDLT
jgi:transposase InsO family protein